MQWIFNISLSLSKASISG